MTAATQAGRLGPAGRRLPGAWRRVAWRSLAWTAGSCALAAGCGAQEEPKFEAVSVPACREVASFGNGRRCDGDDEILACGSGGAVLCGAGWLCFDSAARAFCACDTDADCAGRASYINAARAAARIAPLQARCEAGRCAGAP